MSDISPPLPVISPTALSSESKRRGRGRRSALQLFEAGTPEAYVSFAPARWIPPDALFESEGGELIVVVGGCLGER